MARIIMPCLAATFLLITGCETDSAGIPIAIESESEIPTGLITTSGSADHVAAEIDPTIEGYPDVVAPTAAPPLALTALTKLAEIRIDKEDFHDPLGEWKTRIWGRKSNLENYYVMIGECFNGPLNEDCRGNNLDGLWLHDGDMNNTDVFIRFEIDFGHSINSIALDLGNHTTGAYLTIYDMDYQILLHEEIPPGCCFCAYPPGSGGVNIYARFEVTSTNGVSGFDVTSQEHVKGNVGIDNIVLNRGSPANLPPTATARGDELITCAPPEGATIVLDGSNSIDPEGSPLSYEWTLAGEPLATGVAPTVILPPGTHTIGLQVEDDHGNTHTDSIEMTILADEAPTITLIGDNPLLLECHDEYIDAGAAVSDACDADPLLEIESDVDPNAPGTYSVTYTATDANGNCSTVNRMVEVVDTTPPEVAITVVETNLWPPNNRMHLVATGITASDGCDSAPQLTVTVTMIETSRMQRITCGGKKSKHPDWEIVEQPDGTFDVYVRAERSGKSEARVYTITAQAEDDAGHVATQELEVTVGHDRGKHWRWRR